LLQSTFWGIGFFSLANVWGATLAGAFGFEGKLAAGDVTEAPKQEGKPKLTHK
jgi:hypothetical protein